MTTTVHLALVSISLYKLGDGNIEAPSTNYGYVGRGSRSDIVNGTEPLTEKLRIGVRGHRDRRKPEGRKNRLGLFCDADHSSLRLLATNVGVRPFALWTRLRLAELPTSEFRAAAAEGSVETAKRRSLVLVSPSGSTIGLAAEHFVRIDRVYVCVTFSELSANVFKVLLLN